MKFICSSLFFIHYLDWWLILLSYVPLSLAGGTCLVFSATYTYISWSTPKNLVIVRFAIVEFVVQGGEFLLFCLQLT